MWAFLPSFMGTPGKFNIGLLADAIEHYFGKVGEGCDGG